MGVRSSGSSIRGTTQPHHDRGDVCKGVNSGSHTLQMAYLHEHVSFLGWSGEPGAVLSLEMRKQGLGEVTHSAALGVELGFELRYPRSLGCP